MSGRVVLRPSCPRTVAGVCCVAAVCLGAPLSAQDRDTGTSPGDRGTRIFSDYRFHLNAASLLDADEHFNWDADFGGDIDVIDYGRGRFNFLANIETILGEELRKFDPNQGNYTLEGSATYRLGATELAGTFQHISQHLSDRSKDFPVDWNMAGVQVWHRRTVGRLGIDLAARAYRVTQRSFVDYDSELGGHARVRYTLNDRLSLLVGGAAVYRGTDPAVAGRDGVSGGLFEGGVRFEEEAVAVELFAALERRVDADPLVRRARTWAMIGFRLLSKE